MNNYEETLQFTEAITRRAGPLFLEGLDSEHQITTKSSNTDVTTQTDLAIQNLIVNEIQEHFPHDGILAEENLLIEGRNSRRWIIDPLDGTSNFVRGLWPSAISIGLESEGKFVCGVVFDPVHDELFSAADGHGSFVNGKRLDRTDDSVKIDEAFVGISGTSRTKPPEYRADLLGRLVTETDSIRDLGSTALQLCYVANGRYDAHIVLNVSIWDIAAGFVIAKEAGCLVEGFREGSPASAEGALIVVPSLMLSLRSLVQ